MTTSSSGMAASPYRLATTTATKEIHKNSADNSGIYFVVAGKLSSKSAAGVAEGAAGGAKVHMRCSR